MKLIKSEIKDTYHEIEIENSFLWFKWSTKYRKVQDGNIFRYKDTDRYYHTGFTEFIEIKSMFNIDPNTLA